MREIKFRAWDTEENEMVPWEWFCGKDEFGLGSMDDLLEKHLILMQYTDLKDKNGNDIYEGDILSMAGSVTGSEGMNPGFFFDEEDRVEVAWDNEIAAWSVTGKLDKTDRVEVTYRNHVIQLIHHGACEVIGNIYENPELLEKSNGR